MTQVKSRLHILMGEHKIKSINQLSKETGITRKTLTRLYDDTGTGIDFETVTTLCDYFNCSIGDLFYLEKE